MRLTTILSLLLVPCTFAATFEWTGNGDNISFYQEANWQVQGGGAVAGNPLAPSVAINDNLIFTGTNPNISSQLTLAAATSLQVNGGSLTMTNAGGMSGGSVSISNSGSVVTDWLNSASVSVSEGTLTLRGGGNPLTGSTIACTGSGWTIHFTNETTAAVQSEHLAKITINGQPASPGNNCTLAASGASGSTLTPAVGDTDSDGLPDTWEQQHFGNLSQTATGDPDGDLLDNQGELATPDEPNVSGYRW